MGQFEWERQPKAEQLADDVLNEVVARNSTARALQTALHEKTSTRLFDWVDHVTAPKSTALEKRLAEAGYVSYGPAFHHPGAQLPKIVLGDRYGAAIKVESIADFLMVHGLSGTILGSPLSPYRVCEVAHENDAKLAVVERRSTQGMEPVVVSADYEKKVLLAYERWKARSRGLADEDIAMAEALAAADELIALVGKDQAAWIVLDVERQYWQSRNRAGQLQKGRQDRLGMGWANHDHHTFRSSRRRFPALVELFERLGFHCRERFYAGVEAGWGAQVMENSTAGLILFLDVDLSPEEIAIDFAHYDVPELATLGTIGLWCALHGDSILGSGMHHLEGQFAFEELRADLSTIGVGMMDPFSHFDYLKQAFTKGEMWPVEPARLRQLQSEGKITAEMAERFAKQGAVGSHLENLQRREGYKGFNQKNVSVIIKKTDPRIT